MKETLVDLYSITGLAVLVLLFWPAGFLLIALFSMLSIDDDEDEENRHALRIVRALVVVGILGCMWAVFVVVVFLAGWHTVALINSLLYLLCGALSKPALEYCNIIETPAASLKA